MIIRIQFTLYNFTQQLSQLFKHYRSYYKLIRNAFSIVLACAFCSCLLSCSEIRQSEQNYKLRRDAIIEKDNMIQTINQIIRLATHEMNQNNWISANYHIKNGLDTLGFRYKPRNLPRNAIYIDDSILVLAPAYGYEIKGHLELAARRRMDLLQIRFNQFKSNPL